MRVDDSALARIDEIENVFIPLKDGRRIAARLWLPKDAGRTPVPAIFEYIPYRKRDLMRRRDERMHRYYAAHGYAAVRADVHGSGASDGILSDEYTPREQQDACEIIAWLAAQPWCSGAVGMTGISWGGFNSLQVAARRPPALKAIITLCSSDDRYADDAHYMGGCLLNENMQWGSALMLNAALPPDPELVGERWHEMWLERVRAVQAFPALWMGHQVRDEYWRQGSVCEDYAAIKCPVYAIGGWADGYSNAVPRLLANLKSPCKGLVGPWPHAFPHDARPGPSIGYLQEALRWWDQWLKGKDTGIMDEPRYRVWMQDYATPQSQYAERPGHWVAEPAWPSPRIQNRELYLNAGQHLRNSLPVIPARPPWMAEVPEMQEQFPRKTGIQSFRELGQRLSPVRRINQSVPGRLANIPGEPDELSFSSPQTVGACSGSWCSFGADGDLPGDQRPDDAGSLVFDSDPLDASLELLGAPVVELELRADRSFALLCARLNDVAPDGSVLRVSYGLLNLTHRNGHAAPEPQTPGQWVRVRLRLNDIAQVIPAGHRLRLALSTSYWPIAWPSPEPVVLTVRTSNSRLVLPVRPPSEEDRDLRPFEEPVAAPASTVTRLPNLRRRYVVAPEVDTNETVLELGGESSSLARLDAIGLSLGQSWTSRYRILADDPLSAEVEIRQSTSMQREGWNIRIELVTRLSSTNKHFQFTGDLDALEGERSVANREWMISVPRNGN